MKNDFDHVIFKITVFEKVGILKSRDFEKLRDFKNINY